MRYFVLAFLVLSSLACSRGDMEFYISPEGNDLNSGTKRSPFASISRAQEEVRKLKSKGEYPEAGLSVWLREGEYPIKESIRDDH